MLYSHPSICPNSKVKHTCPATHKRCEKLFPVSILTQNREISQRVKVKELTTPSEIFLSPTWNPLAQSNNAVRSRVDSRTISEPTCSTLKLPKSHHPPMGNRVPGWAPRKEGRLLANDDDDEDPPLFFFLSILPPFRRWRSIWRDHASVSFLFIPPLHFTSTVSTLHCSLRRWFGDLWTKQAAAPECSLSTPRPLSFSLFFLLLLLLQATPERFWSANYCRRRRSSSRRRESSISSPTRKRRRWRRWLLPQILQRWRKKMILSFRLLLFIN